ERVVMGPSFLPGAPLFLRQRRFDAFRRLRPFFWGRRLLAPRAELRGRSLRRFLLRRRARQGTQAPCFDSREMYVRSGAFSSFTYARRAASRRRMSRFVGPGMEPWRST